MTTTKTLRRMDLILYVAGQTPRSAAAIANLKRLTQSEPQFRYRLTVVDLAKNPRAARKHEIVAIPTLVRRLPAPMKKIIGDLSHTERVLVGLEFRESASR